MISIQSFYVAIFGRSADPGGLAYFETATQGAKDWSPLRYLVDSSEYAKLYQDKTLDGVINAMYTQMFGRNADPAGLAFYKNLVESQLLDVRDLPLHILSGAQGDDLTILSIKTQAADLFTAALDTPNETYAYVGDWAANAGRDYLSAVHDTVPTIGTVDLAVTLLVSSFAVT